MSSTPRTRLTGLLEMHGAALAGGLGVGSGSRSVVSKEWKMRRKVGPFLVVVGLLPLVVAASASAQGAVLRVTPSVAAPGDVVNASGRGGYSGAATNSFIRLSTRKGQVLTPFTVDTLGRISADFPVPSVSPGTYLILATQDRPTALPPPAPPGLTGQPQSFGPGRTTLRITAPRSARTAATGVPAGDDGGSTGQPLAVLMAALFALILLAAGSTLTARRLRTLHRPQLGGKPSAS